MALIADALFLKCVQYPAAKVLYNTLYKTMKGICDFVTL